MSSPDLAGTTALVTGASSGIGAAMARRLAAWGCDLILTARRADRLAVLAGELGAMGVGCRVLAEDLGDRDGAARLHRRVRESGGPIDILINNAGHACYRSFGEAGWQRHAELLQVNAMSLLELTHRFLPELAARPRRTHILNVSSMVGPWIAAPYLASYGGSKALVLAFSESLAAELARTNVRVTCLCPGGTTTEFSQVAGQDLGALARAGMMSAERCAAIGLRGMLRGRRVVVPGGSNKLFRLASRFLPRRMLGATARWVIGPPALASGPGSSGSSLPPALPPAGGAERPGP
jgi:uncharacterized protein